VTYIDYVLSLLKGINKTHDNFEQDTTVELGQWKKSGMQDSRDEFRSTRTRLHVYYRFAEQLVKHFCKIQCCRIKTRNVNFLQIF